MQETLFPTDLATPEMVTVQRAPRCRMCARAARWMSQRSQHAAYCGGHQCDNPERLCQTCGATFQPRADGAGSKHCAECQPTRQSAVEPVQCAWCGASGGSKNYRSVWPYICAPCLRPLRYVIQRLRNHHVPIERVRQLLEQPGCEICGANLLEPVLDRRQHRVAPLAVDHDHGCCPAGSPSCGQCVRGLICMTCNTAAGMLRDSPEFAQRLASYLLRARGS